MTAPAEDSLEWMIAQEVLYHRVSNFAPVADVRDLIGRVNATVLRWLADQIA